MRGEELNDIASFRGASREQLEEKRRTAQAEIDAINNIQYEEAEEADVKEVG